MIMLLRKDWRLYRPVFILMAIVVVVPYALAFLAAMYQGIQYQRIDLNGTFHAASTLGIVGLLIFAAACGGCAFAIERRERYADFLAMMPVTRIGILLSKCFITFPAIFVVWFFHCSAYAITISSEYYTTIADTIVSCYFAPAVGVVLVFGIAWFSSVFLKSPSISASIALMACLVIGFFAVNLADRTMSRQSNENLFFAIAFPLGLLGFIAGSVVYTKRVSP